MIGEYRIENDQPSSAGTSLPMLAQTPSSDLLAYSAPTTSLTMPASATGGGAGEFRVQTGEMRSVADTVEQANSSGSSAASEFSSMNLSSTAFGQFGSEVGSASQSLQQQWGQSLTKMLDLLTKVNGDVRTAASNYDAADQDVAIGYGDPTGTASPPAGTTPQAPANATPQQNADWWASLSPVEQAAKIADPANPVGNLDGIPAQDRSSANLNALPEMEKNLRQQVEDAGYEHFGYQKYMDLKAKLDAVQSIDNTVRNSAGLPESERYYLLGMNTTGDGQAILAHGNPDTASRVVTFVPGAESTLTSLPSYTQPRADAMWSQAGGSGTGTSVISWHGYEAPQDIVPHAMLTGYADTAAPAFTQFQDGLRATHAGDPSYNVVVAHSYGSVVVGHAGAAGPFGADAVVFVGSPGVGVDSAAMLHMPPGSVYATEAQNDAIRAANLRYTFEGEPPTDYVHNIDPTSPEFGARTFYSAPGTADPIFGWSRAAHSEYWTPGNPGLVNLGRIINGREPDAH